MLRPSVELFIDNARFKFWESISVTRTINATATMSINIPNPGGLLTSRWLSGSSVELRLGMDTTTPPIFMLGTIEPIVFNLSKGGAFIGLTDIRDPTSIWEKQLAAEDDLTAYPSFSGNNLQTIRNLNQKVSSPLELLGQTSSSDTAGLFSFPRTAKTITLITTHADNANYEWFFDPLQNSVVIRPPKALVSSNVVRNFVLNNSLQSPTKPNVQTAILLSDSVEEDPSDVVNRVLAVGADGVEVLVEDITSQNNFELREDIISLPNITGSAALKAAAQAHLDANSTPRISLIIETYGQPSLNVGDIVFIDDIKFGTTRISTKIHRVIEITDNIGSGGWMTTIQLANFMPRLTDFV